MSLKPILLILLLPAFTAKADRIARTIFLDRPVGAPKTAILFTGKSQTEITLPGRNFSPEFTVPDGDLVLAALASRPAEGEPIPKDAPTARIPASWSRCILLFFPDPDNKTFPVRIIPVNASQADFPAGDTLVFNLSQAKLIASFGNQKVSIPSGGKAVVKPPIAEFGSYPVAINCLLPDSETPVAVCRTNWQHDPESRQILFVTPGPKVPRIWGVLDKPAVKP